MSATSGSTMLRRRARNLTGLHRSQSRQITTFGPEMFVVFGQPGTL